MSALLAANAQLSATASGIANSSILVATAWIKIPTAQLTNYNTHNYLLRFSGATQEGGIGFNSDPDIRLRVNYGGTSTTIGNDLIALDTWVLCVGKFPIPSGGNETFVVYDSTNSTGSGTPTQSNLISTGSGTESLNSILISDTGTDGIPGTYVAEAAVFSASSDADANNIIDELFGGDRPNQVTAGTLLWYRDLVSNGSTGTGTGDLSATGTVTYDDGADHPFAVGGGSTFIPRVIGPF